MMYAVDDHNLRPDVQEPAGLRTPDHRVGGPNALSCVPMVITALSARERQLNQAPNCFRARRSRLNAVQHGEPPKPSLWLWKTRRLSSIRGGYHRGLRHSKPVAECELVLWLASLVVAPASCTTKSIG